MDKKINIRAYLVTDKEHVMELLRSNTPAYFAREEEKDLIFYLDNEIEQYFVVEYENKIVGCGGINFSEDLTTGIISWDLLHPAYQGKGIGSLLLQYRIDKLKLLKQVKIIVVRTSQVAYKFYEKNGFVLKEISKDYWAKGFDLYSMEHVDKQR